MAKISAQAKNKIIREFETMKSLEQSTRDLYLEICLSPAVEDPHIKETFKKIADDEKRHIDIVQKIIDTVNEAL